MDLGRALVSSATLVLLLAAGTGSAAQISLEPSKDNTLYEDAVGSVSNGAGATFRAGRVGPSGGTAPRRGLIAFGIAGHIPAGSTIESVTLTLTVSSSSSGPHPVALHRVTSDWGEGNSQATGGLGAPATSGDATWVHTFFDTATWNDPGGDFVPLASATQAVAGVGSYSWSGDGLISDVRFWLDNPTDDFGWILIGNEELPGTAKAFHSRESATAASRPRLVIDFTPIPEPSSFTLVATGLLGLCCRRQLRIRLRPTAITKPMPDISRSEAEGSGTSVNAATASSPLPTT